MRDPWRVTALGLAVVLIVMVGVGVAMLLGRGSPAGSTSPSPTPTTASLTSTPASVAPPSAIPSAEPSASVTPGSGSPSASGPTPASATIRGLKVDAGDDPEGRDRKITFHTDAPASVSMRVAVSARGQVDACLAVNTVELYCTTGTTFTMTGQTSRSNATWALTLRGQGIETPMLDVTLEFPAAEPTVTIEGAWFDGAARPDYNGVVIELSPSTGSPVSIDGAWDGSQPWKLTIQPPSGSSLEFEGAGSTAHQTVGLENELHRIELVNSGAGAERVPFTATFAWR